MSINLLIIFSIIFWIGVIGILFKRNNIFLVLFSIELMYLGIISTYLLLSVVTKITLGQIYGLIILIIAASESAVGLGILITLYRWGRNLEFNSYDELSG